MVICVGHRPKEKAAPTEKLRALETVERSQVLRHFHELWTWLIKQHFWPAVKATILVLSFSLRLVPRNCCSDHIEASFKSGNILLTLDAPLLIWARVSLKCQLLRI